jgi:hypothetical protein
VTLWLARVSHELNEERWHIRLWFRMSRIGQPKRSGEILMKRVVPENIARRMSEEDRKTHGIETAAESLEKEIARNEKEDGGNGTAALARLLNSLNLPTLLTVLLVGGGNLFLTREDGRITREEGRLTRGEAEQVARQVNTLYQSLHEFEVRQKDTVDKLTRTLENQSLQLKNQTEILHNQQAGLEELHRAQQNYRRPE